MRLIDVALRDLRVAEARAVAHQLVRAGPRDSLDQKHVHGVLEHRPVALLLNVLEVLGGGAVHGIALAHIAEPARILGQTLAVARFTEPMGGEMLGVDVLWAGDQRDARRAKDLHRRYCANSRFGVAPAALRSTSRNVLAMSSGMTAMSAPSVNEAHGGHRDVGMI